MLHGAERLLHDSESDPSRDLQFHPPASVSAPDSVEGSRRTNGKTATEYVLLKNRVEIVRYSTAIISALQEALDYSLEKHHNLPPPALRIDDDRYLNEIRNLVSELRKLNNFLETPSKKTAKIARARASGFGKHLDRFLSSYASALGKGAAALTIASAVGLLAQAGVGQEIIDLIWRHLRHR